MPTPNQRLGEAVQVASAEPIGLGVALVEELRPLAAALGLHGGLRGPWVGEYAGHRVV
ncbi:MAG: hypothetical protein HUU35_16325, partial [Armatimonadetes bacterium]|nr:hypothetical protein [Armatimonadota bacterium]